MCQYHDAMTFACCQPEGNTDKTELAKYIYDTIADVCVIKNAMSISNIANLALQHQDCKIIIVHLARNEQ